MSAAQLLAVAFGLGCIFGGAVVLCWMTSARAERRAERTPTDHQAAFTAHTNQALAIVREANLTAGPTPAPGVVGHSLADVVPIQRSPR